MKIDIESCEKGWAILVVTKSWPGSWGRSTTLKKALDIVRNETGSERFKEYKKKGLIVAFLADKNVHVDELGRWVVPKDGHEPIKIGTIQ